jgi:serine/threonine protein kinase
VSGLCFEKYRTTLSYQVNPGYLNKSMFLASGRTRVDIGMRESLAGVRDAVSHLHSLGIIHNDIKPENIMIDEMGRFILIDLTLSGQSAKPSPAKEERSRGRLPGITRR